MIIASIGMDNQLHAYLRQMSCGLSFDSLCIGAMQRFACITNIHSSGVHIGAASTPSTWQQAAAKCTCPAGSAWCKGKGTKRGLRAGPGGAGKGQRKAAKVTAAASDDEATASSSGSDDEEDEETEVIHL